MGRDAWSQGNWNAFVIVDCTLDESRKRFRQVPDQFKKIAGNNAATYWKLQGHQPPPKSTGFAGMSKPYQDWPLLEMTDEDMAWGEEHLRKVKASGKTAPDQDFGNLRAGFAAERVVDRWLTTQDISHTWNNSPRDPEHDYWLGDLRVDLKTHTTAGEPRGHYDADLTESQRRGSGERDWYLFAKLDRSNMTDLWLLGFQTEQVIMTKGAFYRKGEITRTKLTAPVDCWCIQYQELIKPLKWLGEYNEKKQT